MIAIPKRALSGPGAFRLILASLVFVHHTSRLAIGPAAVYLFFCLSGFWIYRMWNGRYSKTVNPYLTYLISRLWRLLPTFLLVSGLAIGIELAMGRTLSDLRGGGGWAHFLLSNTFIVGYNSLSYQPLVPAWSLDIEVQYYLIAPALSLLIASTGQSVLVLLAAAAISGVSSMLFGSGPLCSFLVFFVVGMTVAQNGWRVPKTAAMISAAVGVLLLILTIISPFRDAVLGGASPRPGFIYNTAFNVSWACILMPYAMYTTGNYSSRGDSFCADLSYIIYLLHWPAVLWIAFIGGSPAHRLPYLLAAWVAVFAGSTLIWLLYDKPINGLRADWVAGRKRLVKAIA